jgi:putative DNA primase/helicase
VVVFDEARRDRKLVEKLSAEAPGILRWMVEGCSMWQAEGLGEPEEIAAATKTYRADQDRLNEFLELYYELRSECKVKIADVSNKYSVWCQLNKESKLSGYAFGKAMQERGITRDANKKFYVGLAEKVER